MWTSKSAFWQLAYTTYTSRNVKIKMSFLLNGLNYRNKNLQVDAEDHSEFKRHFKI